MCSGYQEHALELEAAGNWTEVKRSLPRGCQRCEDSEDVPVYFTYYPTLPDPDVYPRYALDQVSSILPALELPTRLNSPGGATPMQT